MECILIIANMRVNRSPWEALSREIGGNNESGKREQGTRIIPFSALISFVQADARHNGDFFSSLLRQDRARSRGRCSVNRAAPATIS